MGTWLSLLVLKSYDIDRKEQNSAWGPISVGRGGWQLVTWSPLRTLSRNRGNRFVFRTARVAECPSVPAGQKLCPGRKLLPPLAHRQTLRPGRPPPP